MPRYSGRDVTFDVPENWVDRSITAFAAPAQPGQAVTPNIVVTRDIVSDDEAVSTYADHQLVELAKRLEGFNLQERREIRLSGLPAIQLRFTWQGASGTLLQQQTFVVLGGRVVLTFVVTALKDEFPQTEPIFTSILANTKFPSVVS